MTKRQHVLLTTSRRPTRVIRTLCRDLSHNLPTLMRMNRGKLGLDEIAEKALELDAEKVMIIDRWKDGQGKIELFDVRQDGLGGTPPVIYVRNVTFQGESGEKMPIGRRIRSIAIATTSNKELQAKRLENVLSSFLGVPVLSLEEAVDSRYDAVMQILTDSSNCISIMFRLMPELVDVGPRIGISHLVWELT